MKWCGVAPRETRLSWDIFHHVQDSDHKVFATSTKRRRTTTKRVHSNGQRKGEYNNTVQSQSSEVAYLHSENKFSLRWKSFFFLFFNSFFYFKVWRRKKRSVNRWEPRLLAPPKAVKTYVQVLVSVPACRGTIRSLQLSMATVQQELFLFLNFILRMEKWCNTPVIIFLH